MKTSVRARLFACLVLVVAAKGPADLAKASGAESPQTSPGAAVKTPSPAAPTGGIVIVPTLERPGTRAGWRRRTSAAYVMVYFKDQTQSAYMAISRDGYTFTDLNDGQPIFDGTQLAEQKGVRDPHIDAGARRRVLPGHDRPAHLRPACGFPHDALATATGEVRLGEQPSPRAHEVLRPDPLDGLGLPRGHGLPGARRHRLLLGARDDLRRGQGKDDGVLHHPLQQQGRQSLLVLHG